MYFNYFYKKLNIMNIKNIYQLFFILFFCNSYREKHYTYNEIENIIYWYNSIMYNYPKDIELGDNEKLIELSFNEDNSVNIYSHDGINEYDIDYIVEYLYQNEYMERGTQYEVTKL